MKTLYRSFLQIFKKGNGNFTKILLLGAGLAMGLVLIAKIYFERTYENFVPDSDRVYRIIACYDKNGNVSENGQTPGAIAPGIMHYSPAVEKAARFYWRGWDVPMKHITASGNVMESNYIAKKMIMADTSFFDIFQRKIYFGNPQQIMQRKYYVMISRTFAEKLKGALGESNKVSIASLIGMTLAPDFSLDSKFTVGGIYEDFPDNSMLSGVDVVGSLETIVTPEWDGTTNWMGNDRYLSFVRLNKNSQVSDVSDGIKKMCDAHYPKEEMEKMELGISYRLAALPNLHLEEPTISRMCQMLTVLSIVVIIASVLNYILIAISSMVTKAKIIAVHKCYGASKGTIYKMIFSDTFAQLAISLLLAAFIVFINKGLVEDLLGAPISSLFVAGCMLLLLLVFVFIFFACGVVPSYLYAKVPIAAAFRGYRENSRKWKLSLLFVQFVASVFFISLLMVTALQYRHVLNTDLGYNYHNVLFIDEKNMTENECDNLKQELSRLPFIKTQSFCSGLPYDGISGNNVRIPNQEKDLFNIGDMYSVDENLLSLLEIPIIAGRGFNPNISAQKEILVSSSFVDNMKKFAGWDDNIIGRIVRVSEHSNSNEDTYTICGVYKDILLGVANRYSAKPSVQFYGKNEIDYLRELMRTHLIRLTEMSSENINLINKRINELNPGKNLEARSVENEIKSMYIDGLRFRNSVLIAGAVVLLITLIGLIGYLRDEVNRRRSEIAIRKINGATMPMLLNMFVRNVMFIAIPAIVFGCICGYLAADRWLEQFTEKIDLAWWIFAASGVFALVMMIVVVLCSTYKAANANPVENLKYE